MAQTDKLRDRGKSSDGTYRISFALVLTAVMGTISDRFTIAHAYLVPFAGFVRRGHRDWALT
jgi:hypothetical protein